MDTLPAQNVPTAANQPVAALAAGTPAPSKWVMAEGWSEVFAFDEAFRAAAQDADAQLAKLIPKPVPDDMTIVRVKEIGARMGGFAGFNHLYVAVEATTHWLQSQHP